MGAKADIADETGAPQSEALPRSTEEALGGQLRRMFDHVAGQPVPDRINDLVEALEERRLAEKDDAVDDLEV